MEDNKIGDGFRRNVQLIQLSQDIRGDCTDSSLNDGSLFAPDQVEVEEFVAQ
jgi:hypothetical protein